MSDIVYENTMTTEESFMLERIDEVIRKQRVQLYLKRTFDIFFSIVGIIVSLPFFFIISIMIKSGSRGPIIFEQVRVGKNGKEFRILKFRTMVVGAENQGLQLTVGRDGRITKTGIWLRKSKLDELPQLFNVFVGEMSFVGPRPEVPKYVAMYDNVHKGILKVRPGITDYASIKYFDENQLLGESINPEDTYINVIMKNKIQLNLRYLDKISVFQDIIIIGRTLQQIIIKLF